jgi:hypothetical protein
VGAPCETNTVGIASGVITLYLDDALDFKKIYILMMEMPNSYALW